MDSFVNNNLIKLIEVSTPVVTAILGIWNGILKRGFSFKYKNQERDNIVCIIKEIESLQLDNEIKDIVIDEYKRLVIRDIKGVDVVFDKYKTILKSGVLDKYSHSQVRLANRFFVYKNGKVDVVIPWIDKVFSIFYLVFSFVFIVIGSLLLVYTMNYSHDILRYFTLAGFSILTAIFGFYTITVFAAPANVARLIKKDLELLKDDNLKKRK